MKKLIIILAIVLIPLAAFAVDEWYQPTGTLAWEASIDAVYYTDPAAPMMYNVYYVDIIIDPDKLNPILIGSTDSLELIFDLSAENGKFVLGIEAVEPDHGLASVIAWSDDPQHCLNGVTFGIHNMGIPGPPASLRIE